MKNITFFRNNKHAPLPAFLNKRVNEYYSERVEKTWDGGHILKGKVPTDLDTLLISNDYLSLANHPYILKTQSETLLEHGNGLLMSAVFLNGPSPQQKFESAMAAFLRSEATVLSQSGWSANTGLIQSIADESTPVYIDMQAHMSLWEGVTSAGAQPRPFRHNDAGSLEKLVHQYGPGVVIVDSVYSTDGSVCPLNDIVNIGYKNGCVLVVDESHSLGTHGPKGAGMVVELGLEEKVHFRTASLAKAFAGRGGIITCTRKFHEYFASTARPAIFSSAILPHEISGFSATLDIIKSADEKRKNLHLNAEYLRNHLDELGYNVNPSNSQIIALEAGPEPQTIILRDALESRGVFGAVFCAPATPKNRSLIRLSVHADLTREQLDNVIEVCADIRNEVKLEEWPSTRRKQRALALTA